MNNPHKNARMTPLGRAEMVRRIRDEGQPLATVAAGFGISEKTARKWLGRYDKEGPAGLENRSSRPKAVANRTGAPWLASIERLRREYRLSGEEIADKLETSKNGILGFLGAAANPFGLARAFFWCGVGASAAHRRRRASRSRVFFSRPDEAAHIVGKIGEADLHFGSRDTDGSHKETHWSLLAGEDMFDGAAHSRLLRIGDPNAVGHRPALWLFTMDARDEAAA